MALDGIFLSRIRVELETALGARVDKIAMPTRDELIFHLRWRGGSGKLLMSAGAGNGRIHFTDHAPENPKSPPMFCMLLRKHLAGAKLEEIRQVGLDRILHLRFESRNELGDPVTLTLSVEVMGRHSNIVLVGPDNRIIDAVKRVDPSTSSVRQILPGMRYALPPAQDKLSLLDATPEQVVERVRAGRDIELSGALMDALEGASPLLCREIAFRAGGGERTVSELQNHQLKGLRSALQNLADAIQAGRVEPVMLLRDGVPKDYYFLPITQYGSAMTARSYGDCSALLDAYFAERDLSERMRQRAGDLLRLLSNTSDRISRKLAAQRQELLDCAKREELKVKGDLLSASLHTLEKGRSGVKLANFYEEGQPEVEIRLDPMLTPVQNAQRYYALYRKADTAEKKLTELIVSGEEELRYIDSVFDALTRAKTEAELAAIRQELTQSGYVRRRGQNPGAKQKEERLKPLRYRSSDGFTILTGRNNVQNDRLTLRDSQKQDIWLHTQKIPGSHTVIVTEGREVPKSTIEEACVIAATNSRARDSAKVPVDFTLVRHVKKPPGAKPGMVTYDHFETVIVDPDVELLGRLAEE